MPLGKAGCVLFQWSTDGVGNTAEAETMVDRYVVSLQSMADFPKEPGAHPFTLTYFPAKVGDTVAEERQGARDP